MSLSDGLAALNLEMPSRIPRTEYSAHYHWDLLRKVTGIEVYAESSEELMQVATNKFISDECWNYDFYWNILIHNDELNNCRTRMGHAEYAAGAVDFNEERTCPFSSPEEALNFNPFEVYETHKHSELVNRMNADYALRKKNSPDAVNMTGIYISCISGLLEIFGWDIMLMAMGIDAEKFGDVTNLYSEWVQQYFDALADCDSEFIMVHDDIVWTNGPFCAPEWYREFVFPNYKKFFSPLHEAGKKIIYTSDGSYNQFIDDIADCGINGFVMEPTTDMAYISEKYGKTHSFIGNADTRILLNGTKDEIYNEVKRCINIGKNCPGFIMAVGNHIPSNTPVENAIFYNEVYEELSRR